MQQHLSHIQEQICWRLVSSPVQAQGERKSSGAPPAARHWQAAAWARAASSLGCWPMPACSRGGPVVLCPDVKGKKNKKIPPQSVSFWSSRKVTPVYLYEDEAKIIISVSFLVAGLPDLPLNLIYGSLWVCLSLAVLAMHLISSSSCGWNHIWLHLQMICHAEVFYVFFFFLLKMKEKIM